MYLLFVGGLPKQWLKLSLPLSPSQNVQVHMGFHTVSNITEGSGTSETSALLSSDQSERPVISGPEGLV